MKRKQSGDQEVDYYWTAGTTSTTYW